MMKYVIFILINLCNVLSCTSQTNFVNCFDSNKLKHGNWVEYDTIDVAGTSYSIQLQIDSLNAKSNTQLNYTDKYEVLKHIGKYNKGKKVGVWKIYKSNETLWMEIFYAEGIRNEFNIFYPNGELLYSARVLNSENLIINEYDINGEITKEKILRIEYINRIEDKKLFIVGYQHYQLQLRQT